METIAFGKCILPHTKSVNEPAYKKLNSRIAKRETPVLGKYNAKKLSFITYKRILYSPVLYQITREVFE